MSDLSNDPFAAKANALASDQETAQSVPTPAPTPTASGAPAPAPSGTPVAGEMTPLAPAPPPPLGQSLAAEAGDTSKTFGRRAQMLMTLVPALKSDVATVYMLANSSLPDDKLVTQAGRAGQLAHDMQQIQTLRALPPDQQNRLWSTLSDNDRMRLSSFRDLVSKQQMYAGPPKVDNDTSIWHMATRPLDYIGHHVADVVMGDAAALGTGLHMAQRGLQFAQTGLEGAVDPNAQRQMFADAGRPAPQGGIGDVVSDSMRIWNLTAKGRATVLPVARNAALQAAGTPEKFKMAYKLNMGETPQQIATELNDPNNPDLGQQRNNFQKVLDLANDPDVKRARLELERGTMSFGRNMARTVGMLPGILQVGGLSGIDHGGTMNPTAPDSSDLGSLHKNPFGIISGLGDAAFSLTMDPLVHLGAMSKTMRAAQGVGIGTEAIKGVQSQLANMATSEMDTEGAGKVYKEAMARLDEASQARKVTNIFDRQYGRTLGEMTMADATGAQVPLNDVQRAAVYMADAMRMHANGVVEGGPMGRMAKVLGIDAATESLRQHVDDNLRYLGITDIQPSHIGDWYQNMKGILELYRGQMGDNLTDISKFGVQMPKLVPYGDSARVGIMDKIDMVADGINPRPFIDSAGSMEDNVAGAAGASLDPNFFMRRLARPASMLRSAMANDGRFLELDHGDLPGPARDWFNRGLTGFDRNTTLDKFLAAGNPQMRLHILNDANQRMVLNLIGNTEAGRKVWEDLVERTNAFAYGVNSNDVIDGSARGMFSTDMAGRVAIPDMHLQNKVVAMARKAAVEAAVFGDDYRPAMGWGLPIPLHNVVHDSLFSAAGDKFMRFWKPIVTFRPATALRVGIEESLGQITRSPANYAQVWLQRYGAQADPEWLQGFRDLSKVVVPGTDAAANATTQGWTLRRLAGRTLDLGDKLKAAANTGGSDIADLLAAPGSEDLATATAATNFGHDVWKEGWSSRPPEQQEAILKSEAGQRQMEALRPLSRSARNEKAIADLMARSYGQISARSPGGYDGVGEQLAQTMMSSPGNGPVEIPIRKINGYDRFAKGSNYMPEVAHDFYLRSARTPETSRIAHTIGSLAVDDGLDHHSQAMFGLGLPDMQREMEKGTSTGVRKLIRDFISTPLDPELERKLVSEQAGIAREYPAVARYIDYLTSGNIDKNLAEAAMVPRTRIERAAVEAMEGGADAPTQGTVTHLRLKGIENGDASRLNQLMHDMAVRHLVSPDASFTRSAAWRAGETSDGSIVNPLSKNMRRLYLPGGLQDDIEKLMNKLGPELEMHEAGAGPLVPAPMEYDATGAPKWNDNPHSVDQPGQVGPPAPPTPATNARQQMLREAADKFETTNPGSATPGDFPSTYEEHLTNVRKKVDVNQEFKRVMDKVFGDENPGVRREVERVLNQNGPVQAKRMGQTLEGIQDTASGQFSHPLTSIGTEDPKLAQEVVDGIAAVHKEVLGEEGGYHTHYVDIPRDLPNEVLPIPGRNDMFQVSDHGMHRAAPLPHTLSHEEALDQMASDQVREWNDELRSSQNGNWLHQLVNPLREGTYSESTIEDAKDHLPLTIPGNQRAAMIPGGQGKILKFGHEKVIGPMIDSMSRNTLFATQLAEVMKASGGIFQKIFTDPELVAKAEDIAQKYLGKSFDEIRPWLHEVPGEHLENGTQAVRNWAAEQRSGESMTHAVHFPNSHGDLAQMTMNAPKELASHPFWDALDKYQGMDPSKLTSEHQEDLETLLHDLIKKARPHADLPADRELLDKLQTLGTGPGAYDPRPISDDDVNHYLQDGIGANNGHESLRYQRNSALLTEDLRDFVNKVADAPTNASAATGVSSPLEAITSLDDSKLGTLLAADGHLENVDFRALRATLDAAVNRTIPWIHDPMLRSQFADTIRHFVPFSYAIEQQARRFGRQMLYDPSFIEKAYLGFHAMETTGMIHKDDQTGEYTFWFPGSSLMSEILHPVAAGIFGGGVKLPSISPLSGSINSMIPNPTSRLPIGSPMLGLPLHLVNKMLGASLGQQVAPGTGLVNQVLPPTLSHLYDIVVAGNAHGDNPRNLMSSVLGGAVVQHALGNDPQEPLAPGVLPPHAPGEKVEPMFPDTPEGHAAYQKALDAFPTKVEDYNKGLLDAGFQTLITRAIFQFFSPSSVTAHTKAISDLHPEFQDELKATGDPGLALINMHHNHPDISLSKLYAYSETNDHPTGITSIPATHEALQWFNDHPNIQQRYPQAASLLIPGPAKEGLSDLNAYHSEMAKGMRQLNTPDQQYRSMYVARDAPGYKAITDARDRYLSSVANNPNAVAKGRAYYNGLEQTYLSSHPVYEQALKASQSAATRDVAMQQIRTATGLVTPDGKPGGVMDPELADNPTATRIRNMVEAFDKYQLQRKELTQMGLSKQYEVRKLDTGITNSMEAYVARHPDTSTFYEALLKFHMPRLSLRATATSEKQLAGVTGG